MYITIYNRVVFNLFTKNNPTPLFFKKGPSAPSPVNQISFTIFVYQVAHLLKSV